MRDFKSKNRSRDSGPTQLHDAVCDSCGDKCKVPFKPSGGKPIYCSNCFEKKGGSDSGGGRPRYNEKRNFSDRRGDSSEKVVKQLESLNTKLDTIINLLSATPAKSKPKKKK